MASTSRVHLLRLPPAVTSVLVAGSCWFSALASTVGSAACSERRASADMTTADMTTADVPTADVPVRSPLAATAAAASRSPQLAPPPRVEPTVVARYLGGAAAAAAVPGSAGGPPLSDRGAAAPPTADGGRIGPSPLQRSPIVELAPHTPARVGAPQENGAAWALPATPNQLVWRQPAPAAGLSVSLVDESGAAWPNRSATRDDGTVREVVLEPLVSFPEGRTLYLVAELPLPGGPALWREGLTVEAGATGPPPWAAKTRGGRRR